MSVIIAEICACQYPEAFSQLLCELIVITDQRVVLECLALHNIINEKSRLPTCGYCDCGGAMLLLSSTHVWQYGLFKGWFYSDSKECSLVKLLASTHQSCLRPSRSSPWHCQSLTRDHGMIPQWCWLAAWPHTATPRGLSPLCRWGWQADPPRPPSEGPYHSLGQEILSTAAASRCCWPHSDWRTHVKIFPQHYFLRNQ